ncbi:SIMPL domain-containing protein [Qipengyuania sp. YG27]|uniref:SIMPL domain-containing protein n=1 Tax=Qipengyuania mesophila TaxID=2867246 RepID=A0ABS7JQU1_9SPHN|nr:SIMPL domain-containing protein [Qipengyuania mesophila]MBX7499948.1 SIMPL domain-containing protein [Qipengyuania mesophila]
MRGKIIAALALTLLASPSFAQSADPAPVVSANETILRVSGEGTLSVAPEMAKISVGVSTTGATALDALSENNRKSGSLVEAIRAAGIAGKDVQTNDLSVEPEYAEDEEVDRIIGWRATNTLTITTSDLENLGDLITVLFEAGGNTADTPDFGLTERSKLRATRQAERKALEEARDQAEATAEALGMRIARTLLVSDSKVSFTGGGRYIVVTGSRMARSAVPIEPGLIEVEAKYSVEYALVPL